MSFKGMGLYMEDRETYLRLYGRDLPETLEAPAVVDLEELGGTR
jgi:hypothetical protein